MSRTRKKPSKIDADPIVRFLTYSGDDGEEQISFFQKKHMDSPYHPLPTTENPRPPPELQGELTSTFDASQTPVFLNQDEIVPWIFPTDETIERIFDRGITKQSSVGSPSRRMPATPRKTQILDDLIHFQTFSPTSSTDISLTSKTIPPPTPQPPPPSNDTLSHHSQNVPDDTSKPPTHSKTKKGTKSSKKNTQPSVYDTLTPIFDDLQTFSRIIKARNKARSKLLEQAGFTIEKVSQTITNHLQILEVADIKSQSDRSENFITEDQLSFNKALCYLLLSKLAFEEEDYEGALFNALISLQVHQFTENKQWKEKINKSLEMIDSQAEEEENKPLSPIRKQKRGRH